MTPHEEKLFKIAMQDQERTYEEIKIACSLEELFQHEIEHCKIFINETFDSDELKISHIDKVAIDFVFTKLQDYKQLNHIELISLIQHIVQILPYRSLYAEQAVDLRSIADTLRWFFLDINKHINTIDFICHKLFQDEYQINKSVFEKEPGEYYSHDYLELIISIGEAFPSLQPEP